MRPNMDLANSLNVAKNNWTDRQLSVSRALLKASGSQLFYV